LALDAQAGGACAVVLGEDPSELAKLLADPRLRTPLEPTVRPGARSVRVPASFVVHRQLFRLLDAARDDDGERDLARDPFPIDVPFGFEALDVKDAASARRAERALFRALRKPQDGWTSRWLNRYVSLFFSRFLVKTPLRPNQVSIGILAVGLFGAWLAARGGYWNMALGAFLFQMQSILDGCDGEMSRITHRGSLTGEWLDTVGDDLTNYGFFGATGYGLWITTGSALYLVAGAVTVGCGLLASGIEYRYLIKIGSGDLLKYPMSAAGSEAQGGLFAAIQPLFKRDTFVFLTFLAALGGQLGPMLVVFSLGGIGILISVFAAELRMARERRDVTSR
jgi:phosphatidylglycerophosphate synthase